MKSSFVCSLVAGASLGLGGLFAQAAPEEPPAVPARALSIVTVEGSG